MRINATKGDFMFTQHDADKDGFVSLEEAKNPAPQLRANPD